MDWKGDLANLLNSQYAGIANDDTTD